MEEGAPRPGEGGFGVPGQHSVQEPKTPTLRGRAAKRWAPGPRGGWGDSDPKTTPDRGIPSSIKEFTDFLQN